MTQPVNDEQHYGDEQLGGPEALFDPEDHAPIPIDGMIAYEAFLMAFLFFLWGPKWTRSALNRKGCSSARFWDEVTL